MKKLIYSILFFVFITGMATGATLVSVDDNTPTQGQALTVTATGLGAHNLDIQYLGGASGNIENGTLGNQFLNTNWSTVTPNTTQGPVVYSNTRSYSGSQSIESSYPLESQYDAGFTYSHPNVTFSSVYASWWVYFDHVDSTGQWKQWRIRPQDATSIYGDTLGEIMQSGSPSFISDGSAGNGYTLVFGNTTDPTGQEACFNPPLSTSYNTVVPQPDTWIRFDLYAKGSSAADTFDGTIIVNQTINGNTTQAVKSEVNNVLTRTAGVSEWGNFVFQNYWGNISVGTGTNEKIYYDDVYLQFGNRAHWEITNNADYASSTIKQTLMMSALSDTSATITFETEITGTSYLYFIDEDGIPSNPITINGEPVTAPTNVISTTNNQTVSNSAFTINGTATATTGRTITSVTIPGETVTADDGTFNSISEAWTCNVTLAEGANSYTATATDSSAETGQDSISVTYTPVVSTGVAATSCIFKSVILK